MRAAFAQIFDDFCFVWVSAKYQLYTEYLFRTFDSSLIKKRWRDRGSTLPLSDLLFLITELEAGETFLSCCVLQTGLPPSHHGSRAA